MDEASTTKLNGVESTDDGDDNDDSFEVPTETVHVDRVSGRLKRTAALQANERMASQALESRGIKATQDAAVSGRTTRTRRAAASNPRKRNASPESDEESDEAASNSVVPWVSPNQVFNIAYIDEEIARLSSKVLPADPRLPLVHGPTGGKTVKLPTPDTSMITRCFEERGKVYLGGLLNWLKSASVLPTLNLWYAKFVDRRFPRRDDAAHMPLKSSSSTPQS